ncbi:6857_t:CDS:2 [Ambispora leptoticha]|uniref:6857_t:CDS:1 n=1 Tax=Ambispora leptoticha TaxID=144679 RepID=A0A9N8VCP2_9GLOM|nr:6857_t:CDS:2 [Ambispora leptoticha]
MDFFILAMQAKKQESSTSAAKKTIGNSLSMWEVESSDDDVEMTDSAPEDDKDVEMTDSASDDDDEMADSAPVDDIKPEKSSNDSIIKTNSRNASKNSNNTRAGTNL